MKKIKNLEKNYKKCIKLFLKCVEMKLHGTHPSRETMIKLIKRLRYFDHDQFNISIVREFNEDQPFEEGSPASYYQYVVFELHSEVSESCAILSSLPYKEIFETFPNLDVHNNIEEEW